MGFNPRLAPIPINYAIMPSGATQITGDRTIPIFKAPFACQVVSPGWVHTKVAVAKSATNHCIIQLLNGGAAGSGTSNVGKVVIGSTASVAANAISTLTATGTVANTKLDAGDYLMAKYDEVGALTPTSFVGQCFIVYGHEA